MCLAIPAKIVKINGETAEADMAGVRKEINVALLSDLKTGEFVLLHAGFAIQKIDRKSAMESLKAFREVYGPDFAGKIV